MTRTSHFANPAGESSDIFGFGASASCSRAARRARLNAQASRITLRSTVAAAPLAGISMIAPGHAWAQCIVGGVTVTCSTTTTTTDTTYPANAPNDRHYTGPIATPIIINVDNGAAVNGNGLAVTNTGGGGAPVTNGGTISVDAGTPPTAGGPAAQTLSVA